MMHQFMRAMVTACALMISTATHAQTLARDSAAIDTARVVDTVHLEVADTLAAVSSPKRIGTLAMITPSDDSVGRLRMHELAGDINAPWLMLRSASSLMLRRDTTRAVSLAFILPSISFVSNSALSFGQNDGALWAGKGLNLRAIAGIAAQAGPISLLIAPEFVRSANRPISIDPTDIRYAPAIPPSRSPFSSPFNVYPYSIDLPWRLGDTPFTRVYPGQSSVLISSRWFQAGAATENEWWGPAARNPIVMSDNAPGFPHLLLRTRGPVSSRAGVIDARWITGALHESDWFDNDKSNDIRSLSAIALSWAPGEKSPFTFGFTRSVFAPATGYGQTAARWFDAFRNVGHPNAHTLTDSAMIPGPDQIFSLFTRVVIQHYGLETYLEWGRADFPVSMRDFIEEPIHSRGYTAGMQWVLAVNKTSKVRLQGEVTNVEQSSTYRFRPIGSFYTSRAVPQGYTNEGQLIGAGIGPGSSGNWLAADFFSGPWQGGVTWGRTRFNNDAFFLLLHASRCGHDVAVFPGARVMYTNTSVRLGLSASPMNRYNTYFQNKTSCEAGGQGSDRSNANLVFSFALLRL